MSAVEITESAVSEALSAALAAINGAGDAAAEVVRTEAGIGLRVAAGHVGAHGQQVAIALVARVHGLEVAGHLLLARVGHVVHDARDGLLDVDGRVVALLRQLAREHEVAVQNGAGGEERADILPFDLAAGEGAATAKGKNVGGNVLYFGGPFAFTVAAQKVMATNTTATNIVALY